jgi:hypothetical protein
MRCVDSHFDASGQHLSVREVFRSRIDNGLQVVLSSVNKSLQLLLRSPNDKAGRSLVAYKSFAHFRVSMEAMRN